MKVLKLNKLNKSKIKEVEDFVAVCLRADGLKRNLYLDNDFNFYSDLDSFYLLYENQFLKSVLTILQPLEDEAEISAYTLPHERNKGFFNKLFQSAMEELSKYNISRVYFVTEPNSESARLVLKEYKARYSKSEYLLVYDFNNKLTGYKRISGEDSILDIVEIRIKNQEQAVILSSQIFSNGIEEAEETVKAAIETESMKCYGAYLEKKLIGICNVSYGMEQASIFGFGINPICQGKGYGRCFLKQLLSLIEENGMKYVTLHVSSDNQRAFSLYQSEGFNIKTQHDYYEYTIKVLG